MTDRLGVLPRIGIRPTIDAREGGVRESLEEQTMQLARGRLAAYRELGVSRVIAQLHASAADLDVLTRFRDDAFAAGAELS